MMRRALGEEFMLEWQSGGAEEKEPEQDQRDSHSRPEKTAVASSK